MRLRVTLALMFVCHALWAQDPTRCTVSISAATQNFDYYSPWKQGDVAWKTLTGCVISGPRILTLAQPLANHKLVQVSKFGSQRKYAAEVLLKDYNCGLALLEVKDKGFFADLESVELAPSGRPRGRAVIAKWDPHGSLKGYIAEPVSTSIEFYGACGAVLLHHMTTNLDSGGTGEPVFQARQLLGITTFFDSARKAVKVCAADTIRRMVQDLDDGKYGGAPFFAVGYAPLGSDENLRDYLGLGPTDAGILVTHVPPKTSGRDVLKKNDVILSIDGSPIDDRGLYDSGAYGRLNFYALLALKHSVGDRVTMQIFRDRKKMEVSFELLPMTNDCYLIPVLDLDTPPRYYIFGGLVFQELTEGYIRAWGKGVDKRLAFLYDTLRLLPSPERTRVVILNRVLPASVNVGYHNKRNLVLLSVNGTPVRDLAHFKQIVEATKERFLKFEFQGEPAIVLDRQWVAETNDSILKNYNIPAPSRMGD